MISLPPGRTCVKWCSACRTADAAVARVADKCYFINSVLRTLYLGFSLFSLESLGVDAWMSGKGQRCHVAAVAQFLHRKFDHPGTA
jgi:hypothetical protein